MNKKNVLIFPCGTEIGLEINRALANSIHFEMYGASSKPDHGKFVYKNYIEGIPFVDNKNFIDEVEKVCQKYKIDFIIPAHDSVVLKLAQNAGKLSATVITSPLETCEIARSKSRTYKILKNIVAVPRTYNIHDKKIIFPVFIKPDVGQGSKGAFKVNTREDLNYFYKKNSDIIISEFLSGSEYTIDCFTDKNGELIYCHGRVRDRINNGISVNSKPIEDKRFEEIAKKINATIKFNGMWFFQLKKNADDDLILLELAPRIAGTMGLFRVLGVNFIQLALFNAMGFDVDIIKNRFYIEIDRALYARYKLDIDYENVYVDLDDTLLLKNKVNTDVIKFLYQAINEKKNIILITKHKGNIYDTLNKVCISSQLFGEIIHIDSKDDKYKYIKRKNSIFIDDSFKERRDVSENLNIPVFSVDAIEGLICYKK